MKNKMELQGTGKVFRFTLRQMFRNKSYIATLILLAVLLLLSVPVMTLIMGGDIQVTSTAAVETVYVSNETEIPFDTDALAEHGHFFSDTAFVEAEFAADEWMDWLDEYEAYVRIADASAFDPEVTSGYQVQLYLTENTMVDGLEQEDLLSLFQGAFTEAQYAANDITEEQLAVLTQMLEVNVRTENSYLDATRVSWEAQYGIQLVYAILVMMCSVYTVTYIIQSLAEEKVSKLVEFLLVSVKPLALVLGKILACMTYVLAMIGIMVISFGTSYVITGLFMDVSVIGESMALVGFTSDMLNISPMLLVVILISLALGYSTFALLAGLFGSACASIQDTQRASTVPMLIIMGGYMVAIMSSAFESRTASAILSLIPGVSVFCAPVEYMVGNIGLSILLISWLIQAAVVVLLAWFGGKIYHDLILYRGGNIGIRKMIALAAEKRAGRGKNT